MTWSKNTLKLSTNQETNCSKQRNTTVSTSPNLNPTAPLFISSENQERILLFTEQRNRATMDIIGKIIWRFQMKKLTLYSTIVMLSFKRPIQSLSKRCITNYILPSSNINLKKINVSRKSIQQWISHKIFKANTPLGPLVNLMSSLTYNAFKCLLIDVTSLFTKVSVVFPAHKSKTWYYYIQNESGVVTFCPFWLSYSCILLTNWYILAFSC